MQNLRHFLWTAAALVVTSALAPAQSKPKSSPDEATWRSLAELTRSYLDARREGERIDGARQKLNTALNEAAARFTGWDPLRDARAVGRLYELATDASKPEGRDGKVELQTSREGAFAATGLEWAYRLPKDYDPALSYPLLIAIPDHGERPADHIREHWTLPELRDTAIVVSPAMPQDRNDWSTLIVNGRPGGLCHALTVLRIATERFHVDPERIHAIGRGRGVVAAVACGAFLPQRFAGVGGRSGDAGSIGPESFTNVPTYFAAAGAEASTFADRARAAGHDNCTLAPTADEAALWKWMKEHPRVRLPQTVTVVPSPTSPNRGHWVRVAPSTFDARATARLDKASNTVTIEAGGVAAVTLMLNDELLDLDRPIKFVCGELREEKRVGRSVVDALDMLAAGVSDPGCVYVGRVTFSLIAPADAIDPKAVADRIASFERDLDEAGDDLAKLWRVYELRAQAQDTRSAQLALQKIVRLSPEHDAARKALGHVRLGERWMESQEQFERFQRMQEPIAAAARGWVKNKGVWMSSAERALMGKGLVRARDNGLWLDADERDRLAKGWARQDLEWIEPSQLRELDRGRWRIDGEWFELAAANDHHAQLGDMWVIPGHEFVLHTTLDREVALLAFPHMGRALDDLRRVFGTEPTLPLHVGLMREEEQYDFLAFGEPDGRRRATHMGRLHTLQHGFFAESWFVNRDRKREFQGMGVGCWEANLPGGHAFGLHSARFAAAMSFVEALDPSTKTVASALASGPKPDYYDAYRAEKRLPEWLRVGAAMYAMRYFRDPNTPADGDAWWARKWSLDNLRLLGELDPLETVFAFRLDPDRRDASRKLLLEAGLVVAFLVDGNCPSANAALLEFQRLFAAGRHSPKSIEALVAEVTAHQAELRAFAGL